MIMKNVPVAFASRLRLNNKETSEVINLLNTRHSLAAVLLISLQIEIGSFL